MSIWTVDKNGLAEFRNLNQADLDRMDAAGERYWSTLTGAVMEGGARATSFQNGVKKIDLYDTRDVIANNYSEEGLRPVRSRAEYRVECMNGVLRTPALWRSEAIREGMTALLREHGERPWHLAMLDTDEVTVFLTADTADGLDHRISDAVRRLYPGYRSVPEAKAATGERITLWTDRDHGPGGALYAAAFWPVSSVDAPIIRVSGTEPDLVGKISGPVRACAAEIGLDAPEMRNLDDVREVCERMGAVMHGGYAWLADALIEQAVSEREGMSPSM